MRLEPAFYKWTLKLLPAHLIPQVTVKSNYNNRDLEHFLVFFGILSLVLLTISIQHIGHNTGCPCSFSEDTQLFLYAHP
jgi:hypothetical protein